MEFKQLKQRGSVVDMSYVEFTVNGQRCRVDNTIPQYTSLNAYLRYHLCLFGTKSMCHQGVCGSCIVMVTARRPTSGLVETFSVNSCLVLAFSCHGWDITTVEGVGNRKDGYSVVQQRMAALNATQCGYCTPGFVMQIHSLLDKGLTMAEMENSFAGNTCRCTGFRPILDTIKSFASDAPPLKEIEELSICSKGGCGRGCCDDVDEVSSEWCVVDATSMIKIDWGREKFYKVYTVDDIFAAIREGGEVYRLIDGNTGKGALPVLKEYPPVLIDISEVSQLKQYYFDQNLVLGANISLEQCMKIFKAEAKEREEFAYLAQFVTHMEIVANVPVRNIGSVAGNLMVKHMNNQFQSDMFLLLESVGTVMTITSGQGEQTLTLPEFLKQNMNGFLIVNLKLPPLSKNHAFRSFKIAPRVQNALAMMNAAFNFKMNPQTMVIEEATIVYGHVSGDFIHATNTERFLTGRYPFNNDTLQRAINSLDQEINPLDVLPAQTPASRKKLAIGLFYKYILGISPQNLFARRFASGANLIERPISSGKQSFPTYSNLYPISKPLQKYEGTIQSSGEATYANDLPRSPNDVFAAFVLSTVHRGAVDYINYDILNVPGVIALFSAKDIPGVNSFTLAGMAFQSYDEEILAFDDIKFYGQPVAILVAESEHWAQVMAEKVKVSYKNVSTQAPVVTIDDAKKETWRYREGGATETIVPKGRGTNVRKVIRGKYEIGAQFHYHMEPHTCVVRPVDVGYEVFSSSQWMSVIQVCVSRCLGIKDSQVLVRIRRIGGGFGSKISRSTQIACATAIVARNLNRPCRFIMPFASMIAALGRRLPSQCNYEVGVDDVGKIQYIDAEIVEDVGCSFNEIVSAYTVNGFKNCYNPDYFSLKTAAVLTDLPSNTSCRAPGTLEGMASIENIMEHIAFELGRDPIDVRLVNMREADNKLPDFIQRLKRDSDYDRRNAEIKQFNRDNRWIKKGISTTVMLFPVHYFGNYSAMVSIYRGDGSVTITTGGVEMGQGVNTKAVQVCAHALGIPVEYVSILPNYSFSAPNNVFSGSSIVSESVCYSVIKSCEELKARLAPIREKLNNPTWLEVIRQAATEQIDLSAKYMMNDRELPGYPAFGVTICEVTLDVLTGRYQIDRVDLLEDAGISTNPAVDIGQLEGAYVQGLSYHTLEHFVYSKEGKLMNANPLDYDVYLAKDIPVDLRVSLEFNSNNPTGVAGSKAIGEMGICMSHGIRYALRNCILESRNESGYTAEWFDLAFPHNSEHILKALNVNLSELVINN